MSKKKSAEAVLPLRKILARSAVENGARTQPADLSALQDLIGHRFRHLELLDQALTHSSLAYEANALHSGEPGPATHDNEQLEFIGDAVLGLLVADLLYRRFPHLQEGDLTRLRASLVSRTNLVRVGERIMLGLHLRLGRGEERSGGRSKGALLANAVEAVLAAMYLDGGLEAARPFVEEHVLAPALAELTEAAAGSGKAGALEDSKSALQEHLQSAGIGRARYDVVSESGPPHQRVFSVELRLLSPLGKTRLLASAAAGSKKAAQQEAARLALLQLRSMESAS
jgi:ribonuclease-3